jgi:PAS domain-containing protein
VLTVYSYALNIVSSIILLRQSGRLFRLYQVQSMILFVAAVIPWIGNVLYNTRSVVIIDLTPVAFTFTGALIWWNMRRFSLFDVVPVSRESLFTKITELFIVLDAQRHIVDMNESAQHLFPLTSVAIGTDSQTAFVSWPQLQDFISAQEHTAELLHTGSSKGDRWFSATKTELTDPHNNPAGVIVICRDITSEKSALFEREQLIAELKGSLANVKRLTGLLSICASCKKIKNEEGEWQQLEAYITKHTDATFSHGICPDCMAKIYPSVKQRIS